MRYLAGTYIFTRLLTRRSFIKKHVERYCNLLLCVLDFREVVCLIASWIFDQIKALHLYDCLRANKSTSAWGLEARVPFLDKEFIDVAMSIDPEWKMVKYITSESFLFSSLWHSF